MDAIPADHITIPNNRAPALHLLGDFSVEPADLAPHGRKARALLARLVLATGPLARDRLSSLLWSRRADAQAHASLRQCLVELKAWTRASPPLIRADRETVALAHDHVADDISLIRAACARSDADLVLGLLPLDNARLLADLDGIDEAWDDWLAGERAHQEEVIVRDVLAMAEHYLDAAAFDQALALAERITRFDPCSEHAARLVMRARWQIGDDDGVRHAWQRIADAAARGLDAAPSAETHDLYQHLMARRPAASPAPPPVIVSPVSTQPSSAQPRLRAIRFGAFTLALSVIALAGADAPRGGSGAATPMTPVVRIEPVVSRGNGAVETRFADALAGDFARIAGAVGGAVRVLDGRATAQDGDFIVRVAIESDTRGLVAESRVVDATNGSILWSDRLTGSAGNVARLRERTAMSIAGMIDCALSLNGKDRVLAADPDRRGLVFAICDADIHEDGPRALALLAEMTERWPRDTTALGQLSLARAKYLWEDRDPVTQEQKRREAIGTARRALAADPDNVQAIVALSVSGRGELYMTNGLPLLNRALAIDPDYSPALAMNALGLFQAGFVKASVGPAIQAAAADPTSAYKAMLVVRRLAAAGRLREASERMAEVEAIWPGHPILAEHDQRLAVEIGASEAAAIYARASPDERRSLDIMMVGEVADPGRSIPQLAATAEIVTRDEPAVAYQLAAHYTRVGNLPLALAWLDRAPVRGTDGQWSLLYWPSVAPLRREPRFFAKMARIGLVDYWRRAGRWPDFCREPGLRYDCRREAERLVRAGRAISAGSAASR